MNAQREVGTPGTDSTWLLSTARMLAAAGPVARKESGLNVADINNALWRKTMTTVALWKLPGVAAVWSIDLRSPWGPERSVSYQWGSIWASVKREPREIFVTVEAPK